MRIVLDFQARQSYGSHHRGIGRYALSLSQAMARNAGDDDIHLLVNAAFPHYAHEIKQDFNGLIPPERIHAFTIPTPTIGKTPANAWRARAAEWMREHYLLNLKPDAVHISSLFEGVDDDIVTSVHLPQLADLTAVTLHDLIPLMQADHYLHETTVKHWYYRKLQSLKNAGLILAVSDYSRQEGIDVLGLDADRVFTIHNAVSADFRPLDLAPERVRSLQKQYGINRAFILYIGGVEHRKNVDNLIIAYNRLGMDLRKKYQLVIAGKLRDYQRDHLLKMAQKNRLGPTDMVMTGAIDDNELIALYNMASLFVFPSLYEGFGLPVLEAMACGCPTIVADNSSLPEVVGWREATFNGLSVEALTSKMHQVLTNKDFRQALMTNAQEQVKKFSWDGSARQALDIFREQHARNQAQNRTTVSMPVKKPLLAFVDNLLDLHARYLLPALALYYDIEIITERDTLADAWILANFPLRSRQWLHEHPQRYQRRVYNLHETHCDEGVLALMREQPGTLLLHSLYLPTLQSDASMLYLSHGYEALMQLAEQGHTVNFTPYPANKPFLDNAIGIIALQEQDHAGAQAYYGQAYTPYWVHLPPESLGPQAICMSRATGQQYFQTIEQFYAQHPLAREQSLLEVVDTLALPVEPSTDDWLGVAQSVVDNRQLPRDGKATLFYEVSIFVWGDHATGVHRVTRNVLEYLLKNPPENYRIEPVYASEGRYRYARKMTHELLGLEPPALPDSIADFHRDDVLLHVDLGLHIAADMEKEMEYLRTKGVQVYYLVHDILAVRLPQAYFEAGVRKYFRSWLDIVTRLADGLICTTRSGLLDLQDWLHQHPPQRFDTPRMGYCTLGANIPQLHETISLSEEQEQQLALLQQKPTFLMVSTIEPRKGFAQAVAAFSQLWEQGLEVNLVLVGRQGWNVEELIEHIINHPEQGKHLHWMKFISDAMLVRLYETCSALLMASEGEGFGLPLIEAAQHGLPVIARDIPVFREIAGEHAFYFKGTEPQALTDAIQQWLVLWQQGNVPQSQDIAWITWQESTEQIKTFLFGNNNGGKEA